MKSSGRFHAALRRFNKATDIYDRRSRRAEAQSARWKPLIHKGRKP